jgi:hypothetical protein
MIEKCSIGKMSNSLQNLSLIILILILIIVILFYIRNSNLKHNELIEKYTTTGFLNQTPDISYSGSLTATNNTSMFPSQGTVVTLRTCQVNFNNDGTSKYEYQDEWKEILRVNGEANDIPVKTIGYDNTTNVDAFGLNFSERSRCFKELDETNTETYKYKYLNNDLIQYDKNNYVYLTSNINGADVTKKYMEMKFNILGSSYENLFNNTSNSICSLNYSNTLRTEGSSGSSTLGNTELYRLKLTNGNIIETIEKITIDPTDNHVFNKDLTFSIANLTGTNTGIYKYDTANKLFVYEPRNSSASQDIRTINLYQFERNLFCDKQEIKSYKTLNNAKIDMIKFINYNVPQPTPFADTTIPVRYITEPTYSTYISNIKKENSKTGVYSYLNDLITNELITLNTVTSNILQEKRDANQILVNARTAFIEPSNNSKGKFIQNAIIKNNYDDDDKKYKLLLSKDYYDLGFGDVTYSSYTINEGHSSIKVNSGYEPILQEFYSETGTGTQDVYEIKVYKENDTFNLPVKTEGCEILIVGGGGAGGNSMGGGGGAGGVVYTVNQTLQAGTYNITVGKGGQGLQLLVEQGTVGVDQDGKDSFIQLNGTDVSLSMGGVSQSLRGKGGGGGGVYYADSTLNGRNGGSGGGCTENNPDYAVRTPGSSTQGNTLWNGSSYVAGGKSGRANTTTFNDLNAGGGGGAGDNGSSYKDGNAGVQINITGTPQFYAAGGGGGQYEIENNINQGIGGSGIGGNGRIRTGSGYLRNATSGVDGTGSGGGGGSYSQDPDLPAGSGGSGIVIIKYKKIAEPIDNNVRKKITLEYKEKSYIREFRHSGGTENQTEYRGNNGLVLPAQATADILVVGGGGGGGYDRAAGGGAGGLLLLTNILVNTGSYTIKVGKGGVGATTYGSRPNDTGNGFPSSIVGLSGAIALGGGRGGTAGLDNDDFPKSGGSGGGGTGNAGWATNTGGLGTSGQGYKGGNMNATSGSFNSAGGGGAGGNGGDGLTGLNPENSGNGGIGRDMSSYFGTSFGQSGWFAGGGGGSIDYGSTGSAAVSTTSRGGQGGGGNAGLSRGQNGSNGLSGTGGGGGGGANIPQGSGGNGGSGIVIVKYKFANDSKRYRLHFPRKTKVQFILNGGGNRITSDDLQGTYIITITSTKIFIEKEGEGPNNKKEFPSNKIEIIYDLFDTLDNINSTFTDSLTTTKSKPINVYNNTLSSINNGFPFQQNKYNKYKISGFIPKANKNGDNNINFNIDLTVPDPNDTSRLIDMSKDLYSIRYNFQYLQSENEITPIDIYITIKPLPGVINDTISYFAFKTYFRSSGSGLNSSEIQVFLSNTLSIDKFNEISDWITNLNNKNIWGLSNMDKEISDIIRNLLSVDNIDNKCKNDNTANDLRICDIRKLIYIKNKINGTSVSSTGSPRLIQNVSIVSQNVFPRNSPYVNFNIDEYISYESSTLIAPQQRTTTFDIKSTATKYMYFYMPTVSI